MNDRFLRLAGGERVAIDEKGYLTDWRSWTPEVALAMAAENGIDLTEDHWQVLHLFRQYFEAYDIEPPMRALVRLLREQWGDEKGNSRYLYRLFPDGPGTQACRYAGLPRPVSCI